MLNSLKIFDTLDSTNLHAMRTISEGLSAHGDVFITRHQTQGRGQRDKSWIDTPHEALLMSLVIMDGLDKLSIIDLNQIVALSVRQVLQAYITSADVYIKWPNDIYIRDKKVCGILIENGFKGSQWVHAVIGIGVNVLQNSFPAETGARATSIYLEEQIRIDIIQLGQKIAQSILDKISQDADDMHWNELYHQYLWKRNEWVNIKHLSSQEILHLCFKGVDKWGRAEFIDNSGQNLTYNNGEIEWLLF